MAQGKRKFSISNGLFNVFVKAPIIAIDRITNSVLGFAAFIGVCVGGLAFIITQSEEQKAEDLEIAQNYAALTAAFSAQAQSADFYNGTLQIMDGGVLVHDLPYIDYSFDFFNQTVSADGADEADRLFTFPEFEELNPGRIDEMVDAACAIAAIAPNVMDAFAAQNDNEQHPNRAEIEARVQVFAAQNCPG